jgi:hypothetical protein
MATVYSLSKEGAGNAGAVTAALTAATSYAVAVADRRMSYEESRCSARRPRICARCCNPW